jgi:hypothetical protein
MFNSLLVSFKDMGLVRKSTPIIPSKPPFTDSGVEILGFDFTFALSFTR